MRARAPRCRPARARWLKDLASRPDKVVTPWHGEGTALGSHDQALPVSGLPMRDAALPPSRPSVTISLHDDGVPGLAPPSVAPRLTKPASDLAARAAARAAQAPAFVGDRPPRPDPTEPVDRVELEPPTERVERIDPADLPERTERAERTDRAERVDRTDVIERLERPPWLDKPTWL